jgi:hypothetical protein
MRLGEIKEYFTSISAISSVHEVGRDLQGVLSISVVFSTVHEVGREQGVLSISAISSVHEVGRDQGVLSISAIRSVHEVGKYLVSVPSVVYMRLGEIKST